MSIRLFLDLKMLMILMLRRRREMPSIAGKEVTFNRWARYWSRRGFLNVAKLLVNSVNLDQDLLCLRLALGVVDVWKADKSRLFGGPKTNESIIIGDGRWLGDDGAAFQARQTAESS